MDKELRTYLIEKCRNWMLPEEIKALGQIELKESEIYSTEKSKFAQKKMELVYGIGDEKTDELVALGKEKLSNKIAERLLKENSGIVNKCPNCGKLARTPKAKQCRYCGHSWRGIRVAEFKLNGSFQLTNRGFYLTGEILKGTVEKGNYIDLTKLGINCKPEIKNIELVLKNTDGTEIDDAGFETDELTEQQKEKLKEIGSFEKPLEITNSR